MTISPPSLDETRSQMADWVELLSVTRPDQGAARGDILRLYRFLEDRPADPQVYSPTNSEGEPEILDQDRVRIADDILEEIDYRSTVLDSDYPFKLSRLGEQWWVCPEINTEGRTEIAHTCYLLCLCISVIRDGRISPDDVVHLNQPMPHRFQAVATAAARKILDGQAIWFGWLRPDSSGFRQALHEVSSKMCLRGNSGTPPYGASGQEKDAGIDIVAWRDFRDGWPARPVILGQVASGRNWTTKSVKYDPNRFLNWFSPKPFEHFIPSLFIPFPLHHECTTGEGKPFEDAAYENAWRLEQSLGLVIDRLRIVELAAAGFESADDEAQGSRFQDVRTWVNEALAAVRTAA